jgi:RNA polymerase sigma-70 factor (ECF subfamily)
MRRCFRVARLTSAVKTVEYKGGTLSDDARQAFQDADDEFFRGLIAANQNKLMAYCGRFADEPADQCDLVQTTFIAAWEHRASYSGRGSIEGWLFSIARKICHKFIVDRSRQPVAAFDFDAIALDSEASEQDLEEEQCREDVQLSLILALPLRRRLVTLLRLGFGYSVGETADMLGIRSGTVKATLHQAMEWLQSHSSFLS